MTPDSWKCATRVVIDPQPEGNEMPVPLKENVWRASGRVLVAPFRTGQRVSENGSCIQILSVSIERLQWITEEGALCEGVTPGPQGSYECGVLDKDGTSDCLLHSTARGAFEHHWDSSHPPEFWWARNPWVWVVRFEEVRE